MNIKTTVDYIIVGQGLAGSCLALQLLNRGKKIMVFDEPEKNKASTVAAGLFNPITGKRMTKSWKAEEIFPYLFQFYSEAENYLAKKFFYAQPIYRPFVSVEEQNEWMAQSVEQAFIRKVFTTSAFDQVNDPLGGILINQSGYLDVNSFIKAVRNRLEETNSFQECYFDPKLLRVKPNEVTYENVASEFVIFCEGLNTRKNSLFNWVPIRPLKGETLSISIDLTADVIFNRGVYLVPAGQDNTFTVGATYQPNDESPGCTSRAKTELEEKLSVLINVPYQVHHQNWGIRPTTPDRRPILGAHPAYKNVIIFNGLGTKGVSLGPYFSARLAEWLAGREEMQNEVNIDRFNPLYSKFSSL